VEDSKSTPKLNKNGLFFFLMTSLHFLIEKFSHNNFQVTQLLPLPLQAAKEFIFLAAPLEQQTRLPRVPHYLSTGHIHQRADKEGHSMNYFHRSLPASDRLLLHL